VILDQAEGELTSVRQLLDDVKALVQGLSDTRYRLPDLLHKEAQEVSIDSNVIQHTLDRLRIADIAKTSSSTSAPRELILKEEEDPRPFIEKGKAALRDYAHWRNNWADAEAELRRRKASPADMFNRLQVALEGPALELANRDRDREDPYAAALRRLGKEFGDDVARALEVLQPVQDKTKAVDAALNMSDRIEKMKDQLDDLGINEIDLLWQQTMLRILPPSLNPQKKWDIWVESEKKVYGQFHAGDKGNNRNHECETIDTKRYPSLFTDHEEWNQAKCFRPQARKRFLESLEAETKAGKNDEWAGCIC
jgi:hypothetical protein